MARNYGKRCHLVWVSVASNRKGKTGSCGRTRLNGMSEEQMGWSCPGNCQRKLLEEALEEFLWHAGEPGQWHMLPINAKWVVCEVWKRRTQASSASCFWKSLNQVRKNRGPGMEGGQTCPDVAFTQEIECFKKKKTNSLGIEERLSS